MSGLRPGALSETLGSFCSGVTAEGGSAVTSGLPRVALNWKEQAGYGWYVNPADTGNALWARITGADGNYMLTVYQADGGDTEVDSVVVEQGPYQTLEQAKAGANYLVASGAKTALERGEDGHEHKLKHLYVDHGGNDNVTFAECTICGEVFVASPEYTNGEFVPRMPVAA